MEPIQNCLTKAGAMDFQHTEYDFIWEPLNLSEQIIRDDGWTRYSPPSSLSSIPEETVVNEKLREILIWSMQRASMIPGDVEIPRPDAGIKDNAVTSHDTTLKCITTTRLLEEQSAQELRPREEDDADIPESSTSWMSQPVLSRFSQLRRDLKSKKYPRLSASNSASQSLLSIPQNAEISQGECISCFDEHLRKNLVHLNCSHDYCKDCLREVVTNAMKTESAFPPKCCLTEVPLKTALLCLGSEQRLEYKEKSAEYSVSLVDVL